MKFSVVTPSFNQGQYISQTIDSVINQQGDFEIEYFVYDGGSTDKTIEILKRYESKLENNHRIKFYWRSAKDNGQSDAINQALLLASGDILAYINSDDFFEPNIFEKINKLFVNNPDKKWLTGYSNIVNENNNTIQRLVTFYKNIWLNIYNYNMLLILNFVSQPSTFFRRQIFLNNNVFDEKLHLTMDYNYWLKIAKNNHPIILKEYISNFRIHSKSKGKTQFKLQFDEDFSTVNRYTNNPLILLLHRLHNYLIVLVYKFIK